MRLNENINKYPGAEVLAILGWTPTPYPVHHALEAEAAEQTDIAERDFAARVAFARRGVQ